MLENGLDRRALSEAYFAVHQAARGLLASLDIEVRTHRGALKNLRESFREEMSPEMLQTIARLQGLREGSDYESVFVIRREDAEAAVLTAEAFLQQAARLLAKR